MLPGETNPMTPGIRPLVAGNWKMNGTSASLNELRMIGNGFMSGLDAETEALVCVPATLLAHAAEILSRTPVRAGGEDCHTKESERPYRLHFGRDAERCGRQPRHRRSFRTPRR